MKKNIKLLILALIILSSIVLETTKISMKLGSSYAYVLKPMIWIFIGIITLVFFKNEKIVNNKYKKEVNFVKFYHLYHIHSYIFSYIFCIRIY